ncbi:MAG: serine/threonine protein kinase, partial [Gemmataceae bacterium]|nr:serine/threonine protein kinase [Gemmataceae bacterium]
SCFLLDYNGTCILTQARRASEGTQARRANKEHASRGGREPLRIGKYEVVSHVATGGMGAVYKAIDTELNRLVALKVLSPELAAKPAMLARFKREAVSAAKLRHDNIVAIYDSGDWNGTYFLALEFVDGKDLHDYVVEKGKLEYDEARDIAIQAACALDHAHSQDIVHRDIKPSNFLITRTAGRLQVKLTDMGLARQVSDDQFRVTKAGMTIGTVDYMAPEQARNSNKVDSRSDIYSLGCTMFHMLSGKCPFPAGSLAERILKHLQEEPPDIRKLNPQVPDGLARVLKKMLAKKPADRYQTPLELLHALQDPADFRAYLAKTSRLGELASFEPPKEAKKTDETPEPVVHATRLAQPVLEDGERRPKKKRFRDDEEDDQPRKRKAAVARWPAWWPAAAIAGVVFLGIIGWLAFGRGGGAPSNERVKIDEQPPVVPVVVKKGDDDTEVKPQGFVGPPLPDLPKLVHGESALDVAALRKEFLGPFAAAPTVPENAKVVRVSRLAPPGPDSFRSVAEALAGTMGDVVVEIHDQGPLHEATMPSINGRTVFLQGGAGFRPLLAWDVAASALPEKAPAHFLSLTDGDLHLDNLDLVLHWPDSRAQQAAVWFALQGGSLTARACTVSVAGKNSQGILFAQFKPPLPKGRGSEFDSQKPSAEAMFRCRLSRCFVRGADLVVLAADAVPLDVLIDECLLVTGNPATIQLKSGELDHTILRLIRSTLVTGQHVVHWQRGSSKTSAPRILGMAWDTILARANPATPRGDMFLVEGGSLANMNWRPVHCIYAGWRRLIHAADKSIDSGSQSLWRAHWGFADGDLDLSESWPGPLRAQLETLSPPLFDPADTPAAFAATSGPGWIGCSLGRLPSEPEAWHERTYERYTLPTLPLPETDEAPPIPDLGDGYYHGERIDLTKVDLGQYLTARLPAVKAAPKVVLHLAGKGKCVTSPLKVKDLPQLVLYFEPVADKEEPLTLIANPRSVNERAPFVDIENGSLELIHARIVLENRKVAAIPSHLLKITGGDLILNRCFLLGSLDKGPTTYQGLIRWEAGQADIIPTLVLKDTVLISARSLLEMRGPSPRVRLRNNVLLGWDQGLVFTPLYADRQTRFLLLENNTFACRKAALAFAAIAPDAPPIVVQAQGNFFVDCFAEEGRPARLLAIPPADLARGLVLWQGKGNAFDARFTRWLDRDGVTKAAPLAEWKKVWGSAGELSARLLDPSKAAKAFSLEPPSWSHLALPAGLGVGAPPYGADLVRLGLLKKKGN